MQGLHASKMFFLGLISTFCLFLFNVCAADVRFTNRPQVKQFIQQLVEKDHFDRKELQRWLSQVKIRKPILRSAAKPLERNPWHLYQILFITPKRIKEGVEFWKLHAKNLEKAEKMFGTPASIIVATLGVETLFGKQTGKFRVIDSLSNLGFNNSKRAPYFRRELREFFLLVREQKLNPLKIKGSYAGAIGMPQFMPSSYRRFAINFAKEQKADLMNNINDAIASIANYYQKHGWKQGEPVASKTVIFKQNHLSHLLKYNINRQSFTVAQLIRYGIYPKEKTHLIDNKVRLVQLENRFDKEYWMGFHNFNVIKRYNSSNLYAMAVYQLSGLINNSRKEDPDV